VSASTANIDILPSPNGRAIQTLVEIAGLVKEYGPLSARITVLRDLHLTIARGERIALLGRSGSGKSTLLNLLGGLDAPTAGSIRVDGRELAALSGNERAMYRLATVGMIFQSFHLVPSRTALENVELPLLLAGQSRGARRKLASEALTTVGMSHRLEHTPARLSGGERQRVAIARALVCRPKLLLADEPTGNLDTATGDDVVALILEYLQKSGAALVLVTHDEELAQRCATRVLRMQDGALLNA
jgi:predicted ABC-type transport system involved in lysophospholipase L1 biosynthesis ATPase subunit